MADPKKTEAASSDDAYAASYMAGEGRVLLRDKTRSMKLFLVLSLVTLWCGGGAAAGFLGLMPKFSVGVGLFVVLMAALFALLTMTLTVVRTVVSEGEVHVQYGLWGPRVPMARIRECRVTKYDWKKFGGWGIKRSTDGTWAYVMTSGGDVVELSYTDEKGVEQTVLFSASDPHAVVAAINEAQARAAKASASKSKARIATGEAPKVDDVPEEEQEEGAEQDVASSARHRS